MRVSEQNKSAKENRRPVTVVGAGFSGLVTALYLNRAGFRVEVIEKRERVGGMISTQSAPFGLVETAANAILNSIRVEELFAFAGLELQKAGHKSRKRFIYRAGMPRRWPLGVTATFRVLRFLLVYFLFRSRQAPRKSESVRAWGERVIGREASRYLIEAALQGIYAGDPARLSASLIFSKYFRVSRDVKRKPASGSGSVSAIGGMGQLAIRLRERLESLGVTFRLEQEFSPPTHQPGHPLVIATSASDAAPLLIDLDPMRARALASIEMLPLYSVTVSFREAPQAFQGFGCLFPPIEGRKALGVLMNNFIFPKRSLKGFSETWIFGGVHPDAAKLTSLSDAEFLDLAIEERQATLQASADTYGYRVCRWKLAVPHYTTHLEELMPELRGFRCNTLLIGNYLGEIGLASILEMAARAVVQIQKSGEWESK